VLPENDIARRAPLTTSCRTPKRAGNGTAVIRYPIRYVLWAPELWAPELAGAGGVSDSWHYVDGPF